MDSISCFCLLEIYLNNKTTSLTNPRSVQIHLVVWHDELNSVNGNRDATQRWCGEIRGESCRPVGAMFTGGIEIADR